MKTKSKEPKVLEKDIQKQIIEYLGFRKDIYYIRNNSFAGSFKRPNGSTGWIRNNKKGTPDLVLCFKGRWIGCEIKAKNGHQLPDQKQAQADILKCGGEYYIIKSLDELLKIL